MQWGAVVVLAIVCPAIVHADDSNTTTVKASALPRHTVYAEGLGKAGPYGLGYELAFDRRLAIGVAASFAIVRDQQLTTVAPYLHADLVRSRRHSLYADLGLVVVHSHVPSPVPEWDGMSDSGAGGQFSIGWEARPWRAIVRSSIGVAMGEGGVAPFLGLAVGTHLGAR